MSAPLKDGEAPKIVRPAPPAQLGLHVETTRRGVTVRAGRAMFAIERDLVRAAWEEAWSGPQRRVFSKRDVTGVAAAPDERSASGERTARLEIHLGYGEVVVPLRRQPWPEVLWVVARLREELGLQPREVAVDPPAFQPTPLPVAQVQKPARPPKPVASVEAVRRGDGLVLRLGAAPVREIDPGAWVFATLFWSLGASMSCAGMIASASRGGVLGPLLFLGVGVASLALAAWSVWRIVLEAKTRYALRLSPRGLRVGMVEPRVPERLAFLRRAPAERRRFIPRSQIARFGLDDGAAGRGGWRLYAYVSDEDRVSVLARRPHAELAWVAHLLTGALESLPPAGAADRATNGPSVDGAASVLPYERPHDTHSVEIRHFPDGGVVVKAVPTQAEQVLLVVPFLFGLFFLGLGVRFILSRAAALGAPAEMLSYLGVALLAVGDVAIMVWLFRRRGEPEVIGVDAGHLYHNNPRSFRPLVRWPRPGVKDVREGPAVQNRGSAKFVEIVMRDHPPLRLFYGRGEWDRRRVINALRKALATNVPVATDGAASAGKTIAS
jgi:hypothetical protein